MKIFVHSVYVSHDTKCPVLMNVEEDDVSVSEEEMKILTEFGVMYTAEDNVIIYMTLSRQLGQVYLLGLQDAYRLIGRGKCISPVSRVLSTEN